MGQHAAFTLLVTEKDMRDGKHILWLEDTATGHLCDMILQDVALLPTPAPTQEVAKVRSLSRFAAQYLSGCFAGGTRALTLHFDAAGGFLRYE